MQVGHEKPGLFLVLFSHDRRLAQTRRWVLEQAGFRVVTVHKLVDLYTAASDSPVILFLLCNSLPAELRTEAFEAIRKHWQNAKVLIFTASYPIPDLPADTLFPAMEGPEHLVRAVRRLVPVSLQ